MIGEALAGLRVVEAGSRLAVAVCGHALQALGADVTTFESPEGMDTTGMGRHRDVYALGKRRVAGSPAVLAELAQQADVVLVASDTDPAWASAIAHGPRLVRCDITAFGEGARLHGARMGDLEIQALAGIVETTGLPDEPPTPIAVPVVDIMTGLYAACAVILAVRARRQTGAGQSIDMALFDSAFAAMSTFLSSPLVGGRSIGRLGNMHPAASPWNAYRAKDGWVLVCAGSDSQWERLCTLIGEPELASAPAYATQTDRVAHHAEIDARIEQWTRALAVDDCVAKLGAEMIAASRVVPIDDYPREPNLEHRDCVRRVVDPRTGQSRYAAAWPIRATPAKLRAPRKTDAPRAAGHGPLAGLRVIEIGHYTTAPLTSRHCASMGAVVVKLEPPGGESTRTWPPLQNGESIFFRSNNAEKLGICLDLKRPGDAATLTALLRDADVLVENLKPGALDKLGFGWDALQAINPALVYCSITGFGADSIYANRPAFDTVIQAASGFMDALGDTAIPMKSGISSADLLGAQFALLAILAGIEARDRDGAGMWIDLAMQDVAAWATQTAWNGRGSKLDHTVVACSDGYVLVSPHASADAKAQIARASATTREALVASLARIDVLATPIQTVAEMIGMPHCRERRLWSYRDDGGVRWPLLASPLRLLGTPPHLDRLAPRLDEHRDVVLAAR